MATQVEDRNSDEPKDVPVPDTKINEKKLIEGTIIPDILSKGIDLADRDIDRLLNREIEDTLKDDPDALEWFDKKNEEIVSQVKSVIQPIISEQQDIKLIAKEEYEHKWRISDDQEKKIISRTEIEIYKKITNDFEVFGKLLDKNLAVMNKKFAEMKGRLNELEDDQEILAKKHKWLSGQKVKYYFLNLPIMNRLFRKIRRYRATKIVKDLNEIKNEVTILKSILTGTKLPGKPEPKAEVEPEPERIDDDAN